MNWQTISFDWNQVRAFLATAEEGSFSGAARALKTTQPTIGRQISALESALGVTLFERSVRGLTLTQIGQDLLHHVRTMAEAATLISMTAFGQSQEVSGEVTITAPELLSAMILPKVLAPLRLSAPELRVRINATNDNQNLMHREADIAIRHARPDQPDLIGRHVGDLRVNLYAASTYLEQAGRPRTPRDVADHNFIGDPNSELLVSILQDRGIPVRLENFVMSSQSNVVVWELVKSGYGVAMQPEVLGEAEPSVEKVLENFPLLEFPVWLVAHRELKSSRRIRVVFDTLARGLAKAASGSS